MFRLTLFKHPVKLIACGLEAESVVINDRLVITSTDGAVASRLTRRGVIYYKDYHFTCRYWDIHGKTWLQDGKADGGAWVKEVEDGIVSEGNRAHCEGGKAVQAIYAVNL